MSTTSVPGSAEQTSSSGLQAKTDVKQFIFVGTGTEYFRIWIVNLFLTALTFGIYSAWAKVRRLRYFYGLTVLDKNNFEYHARPKQILIGRIVVVAALIIYNLLAQIAPILALALLVPYAFALPWLINKSFAFNARMTSYRNVRLGFAGSYKQAFFVYAIMPGLPIILGAVAFFVVKQFFDAPESITLGEQQIAQPFIQGGIAAAIAGVITYLIVAPLVSKYSSNYIGSNLSYGTARFETNAPAAPFYWNLGFCLGLVLAALVIVGALLYLLSQSTSVPSGPSSGLVVILVLFYIWVISVFFVYRAGVRNIAFNATLLDGRHQMQSRVPRVGYAWVLVTNLVATICSFGLLRAWAAVRTWRYLADHTAIETDGDFDGFVAAMEEEGNVAAAEYFDIEGIDFGL